jgi:hypothetical protein
MPSKKRLSCFVSAPFGVDTSALYKSLAANGVTPMRLDSLRPGQPIFDALSQIIDEADFVICYLPKGKDLAQVHFEAGFALGRSKQVVMFVDGPLQTPLASLVQHASLNMANSDQIDSMVQSMLHAISHWAQGKRVVRKRLRAVPSGVVTRSIDRMQASSGKEWGHEAASILAELLTAAGAQVVVSRDREDKYADLAVWVDELDHPIGNPILVELKRNAEKDGLLNAQRTLQKLLLDRVGACGLIVHARQENWKVVPGSMPLIFQVGLPNLANSLIEGDLGAQIVQLRNRAIHGK